MTYLVIFVAAFTAWLIAALAFGRAARHEIKTTELPRLDLIECKSCGRPSWVKGDVLLCRECAADAAELESLIGF